MWGFGAVMGPVSCSYIFIRLREILGGVFESPAENFASSFLGHIGESLDCNIAFEADNSWQRCFTPFHTSCPPYLQVSSSSVVRSSLASSRGMEVYEAALGSSYPWRRTSL